MVTLASIVEKETGKADERPRVAGVFVNRLEKHMRLDSDPTIVYGLVLGKGTLGRSITKADLNQPTPYNTYIIDGLPPGPICNPGKAALEAVANPARSKDLYFVADGTGGHAFAETLDQHQKNVARWRQIEKDVKDKLAPDVTPGPAIRGSIDPVDPAQFGALVAPGQGQAPASVSARLARSARPEHEDLALSPPRSSETEGTSAVRGRDAGRGTSAPRDRTAEAGSGASAFIASPRSARSLRRRRTSAPASVLARLSRIGADRNAKDAALASLAAPGVKTIEELGAVVAGVNDGPAEGFAFGDDDPPGQAAGPVAIGSALPRHARRSEGARGQVWNGDLASTHARHARRRARSGAAAGTRFRPPAHL